MLKHKKIVVVGGATGIGQAVAQQALEAGAEVIIASRNAAKLHSAAMQLGGRVQTAQVDAADEQSVIDFFQRIGPIDHLAITIKPQLPSGRFLDNAMADVQAAFDAKFWGQYRLLKQGAPAIRPTGSVVLTSGVAAQRSYPGYSAVSAMNAAVEALTKAAAIELAPLRINAVCPGFVDTDPPTPGRAAYVGKLAPTLPLSRLGRAADIASAYLYLFGSAYTTGSVVVVDGGALA